MSLENHQKNRYLYKCIIKESSKVAYKDRLSKTSWGTVKSLDNPNESYIKFIETISRFVIHVSILFRKDIFPDYMKIAKVTPLKLQCVVITG